jgi:DNA-binding NarL/FixJ family response regulator
MGSVALFSTTSNLYNTGQVSASNTTQAESATKTTAPSQEDTVKLSPMAQAKLLHQEGKSVAVIASSLGTDTKTVDDYLGITLEQTIEKTLQSTV